MGNLFLIKPENRIESAILSDEKIQKGFKFGKPRSGHKEGQIGLHVEQILEFINRQDWKDYRSDLRVIALIHDSFKYLQFNGGVNHADYAARYYCSLVYDPNLAKRLNENELEEMSWPTIPRLSGNFERVKKVILYHDENWRFFKKERVGRMFNEQRFRQIFQDVDLDLMIRFNYADSCERDNDTTIWFENKIRQLDFKNIPREYIHPSLK